jgi:hypothetical protein
VTVAVKEAEEITVTANSVIISRPGKRFKFNALRRPGETANSITGAVKGTRLWTTSKTAIFNVTLEDGYLYFATSATTPVEEANAVLAVLDEHDNALWSWHIWMTDFDPAADPFIIGGRRVMNRNLGAFASSDDSPEEAVRSYGLYYQWGRKDPFVGPRAWNSNVPSSTYSNSGYYQTHTYIKATDEVDLDGDKKNDVKAGSLEFAIARPNYFIAGDEAHGFDWLSVDAGSTGTPRGGMWDGTAKSLYDPCPAGWRVAPRDIWAGFTTTGGATSDPAAFRVDGEYEYGWNFVLNQGVDGAPNVTLFLPAAGRRSFSPTLAKSQDNFTNVVNDADGVGWPVGFYWSSSRPGDSAGGGAALSFRRDYVNPGSFDSASRETNSPASGFPLRCVAE